MISDGDIASNMCQSYHSHHNYEKRDSLEIRDSLY